MLRLSLWIIVSLSLSVPFVVPAIYCWSIYEYVVENLTITFIWCLLVYVSSHAGYASLLIFLLVNDVGYKCTFFRLRACFGICDFIALLTFYLNLSADAVLWPCLTLYLNLSAVPVL